MSGAEAIGLPSARREEGATPAGHQEASGATSASAPPATPTATPIATPDGAFKAAPPPPLPGIMRATRGLTSGAFTGIAAPGSGSLRPTRLSREVQRLLASLGATRTDVAASLEAVGARGVPCEAQASPVLLFLAAVVGADPNVRSVAVVDGCVAVEMRAWWRADVTVDLPPVLLDFLTAFDRSCYPALLSRPRRAEGPRPAG